MMHADISPALLEVAPGETCELTVHVINTSDTIDAYQASLFGLDPSWVTVDPPRLSLFPDEAGDVTIAITPPKMFPAGHRQLTVHVRSENDPTAFALNPLGMIAMGHQRLSMRVDPVIVYGGKEAAFGVVVSNDGNTIVNGVVSAIDPEELTRITLKPATLELLPGHQDTIQALVRGKRPWVGQPKIRSITFAVDATTRTESLATFVQKPRLGRWLLALVGLLIAAAVFAIVLSHAFDSVVKESKVDPSLLSAALNKGGDGGKAIAVQPGGINGTVKLLSTDKGIAGVQVQLFDSQDTTLPLASAATADGGAYSFGGLNGGKYKLRFSGAGFNDVWYKGGGQASSTAAKSDDVKVDLGKVAKLDDIKLGARPGSIKGSVKSLDLTGITATLVVPGTISDTTNAQVQTVAVSADGTFAFENVPSPASYQLIVSKAGYTTEIRNVEIGAAQSVEGIEVTLRQGDGVIRGHISDGTNMLGGVAVEATDGTNKIDTVSLTDGDVGAFVIRGLTTPQIYTITISRAGYTPETRTVSLQAPASATSGTAATTITGTDIGTIVMQRSTGSLSGTAIEIGGGPLGGVAVTINAGSTNITTYTASTGDLAGTWVVDELPIPATYTVSFAKDGYVTQTQIEDLDAATGNASIVAVDVALVPANAVVQGVVRGVDNVAVANATVSLSDGTTTRTLTTAHDPLGRFLFDGVAPGAYTLTASLPGSSPAVLLINAVADDNIDKDIKLAAQASATGQVLLLNQATNLYEPLPGAIVRLFLPQNFPGPASSAIGPPVTTDLNGMYHFAALDAPQNYVIAVYQSIASPDPLDSQLILTQPSTEVAVPPFQIPLLF